MTIRIEGKWRVGSPEDCISNEHKGKFRTDGSRVAEGQTLAELAVQPVDDHKVSINDGPKVDVRDFRNRNPPFDGCPKPEKCAEKGCGEYIQCSQAPEQDDKPKTWGEMTDGEKGALLLAQLEGAEIQILRYDNTDAEYWQGVKLVTPSDNMRYRVKPEPKVETVTLYFGPIGYASQVSSDDTTHHITFDVQDGKPVCSSIRMKEV